MYNIPSYRAWYLQQSMAPAYECHRRFLQHLQFGREPQLDEGHVGRGSTHHLALAVDSVEELGAWRDYLRHHGHETTDILDRGGFHSLYLRDPDGHILEIASRTH